MRRQRSGPCVGERCAGERQLLLEKNPELAEFDRVHHEYERRFARSRKNRRYHDGFEHPPTFTLPTLPNKPDWPRFQEKEGWKSASLANRTLQLRVPDDDGGNRWLSLEFVPDARLRRLRRLDAPVKHGRTRFDYLWIDRDGVERLVRPGGLKLIRRGEAWFLSITITIDPLDCPLPVAQQHASRYSAGWVLRKIREEAPNVRIRSCAVDLGVRNLGAATIAQEGEVVARRVLGNRFSLGPDDRDRAINIPSLPEIAEVRRRIGKAQSRAGRPRLGSPAAIGLRRHHRKLCEDRYKKGVAAIFRYARSHGASLVIFEDLKMLRPDTANERGVNRSLQNWNRGNIVRFAEETAEDAGLRVVKVPAWHTSRVCFRCDALGVRFRQGLRRRDRNRIELPLGADPRRHPVLDWLGHWFFCPAYGRQVHADLNASENLHRRFLQTFPEVRRDGNTSRYTIGEREFDRDEVERRAIETLSERALATPF